MSKDKIWLSSPHMGGNELKYIESAFENNWIAPLGPNVEGFEKDLKKYLNHENKEVASLSSGTAAIHLSLILLGVKANDSVICQSMTFSASANPIKYLGANPIFIDSELETWNMCPDALRTCIETEIALNNKPKAVICVHLYGMPAKILEIKDICKEFDIPLIEDAAEALGSTYKNEMCGTFGEFGILSFNGNKIITTSGGGALICNSKSSKEKAVFLATQARDKAPHYQHSEVGYNYRLSNVCAGIGRGQMEVLDTHISLRRKMNAFYQNLFSGIDGISVFKETDSNFYSNHWLSAILVDSKKTKNNITREDIRLAFEKENIESRPLWKPMHLQPVFQQEKFYGDNVAENLFNDGLCLPSGSNLTDLDRDRISLVIKNLFK